MQTIKKDVVRLLQPRWIIPCHRDTMMTPLHADPDLIPGVDLPGFLKEIRAAGCEPLPTPILGRLRFPHQHCSDHAASLAGGAQAPPTKHWHQASVVALPERLKPLPQTGTFRYYPPASSLLNLSNTRFRRGHPSV